MSAQTSEASGKRVFEARHLSKAFGDRAIVTDFSIRILRGERLGLIGPNGAGKTTILKLLTGELKPDTGEVECGQRVEMVTLDQKRESLAPTVSLRDALTDGGSDMVSVGGTPRHVVSYMKDFLFLPEQAGTAIGKLSGGERGRLMLARAFAKPSNVLVLDEPTNDLDLETLDLLQELLAEYAGTVLLVSHDRDFLDRVVTRTIASEGNGRWQIYAGGYSDMLAQRGSGVVAAPADKAEKNKKPPASSGPEVSQPKPGRLPGKLTFKDKHALETLPDKMASIEQEIAALKETLADPDLFVRDPEAFQKTADGLAAAEASLEDMEERWLELEMKREEIEGAG